MCPSDRWGRQGEQSLWRLSDRTRAQAKRNAQKWYSGGRGARIDAVVWSGRSTCVIWRGREIATSFECRHKRTVQNFELQWKWPNMSESYGLEFWYYRSWFYYSKNKLIKAVRSMFYSLLPARKLMYSKKFSCQVRLHNLVGLNKLLIEFFRMQSFLYYIKTC